MLHRNGKFERVLSNLYLSISSLDYAEIVGEAFNVNAVLSFEMAVGHQLVLEAVKDVYSVLAVAELLVTDRKVTGRFDNRVRRLLHMEDSFPVDNAREVGQRLVVHEANAALERLLVPDSGFLDVTHAIVDDTEIEVSLLELVLEDGSDLRILG